MDELKRLVESVKLPITLPESAFILLGKRRIPDLNYIMQQYLSPLLAHLDANATAPPGGGPDSYLIPLTDGRYLKIALRDNELIELALIGS